MQLLNRETLIDRINDLAARSSPFAFIVDFNGGKGYVFDIEELKESNISLNIRGVELGKIVERGDGNISLHPQPISRNEYLKSFDNVKRHILHGDTYLLNLTFATYVGRDIDLNNVYANAKAPYKMLFDDKFTFYSPEPFIRIKNNKIFSYPMKGTIEDSVEDAQDILLNSRKELYEHYTIVDLIRNDLAIVSKNVEVARFRYIARIETAKGGVLQTSSEIKGELDSGWKDKLGDLIFKLLPAGSISGAPKEKTIQIIKESELSERGFYTGVMGYFDGETFDSSVIIRFLEKREDGSCYYHSGGGITALSELDEEYKELITKIYVPLF